MGNLSTSGVLSFVTSFGLTKGYDLFNRSHLVDEYLETDEIPKRKSLLLGLLLAIIFGSYGLLYSSPRLGVFLMMIETFFIASIILWVLIIPLRFITAFVAFMAILSRNKMIALLLGQLATNGNTPRGWQ